MPTAITLTELGRDEFGSQLEPLLAIYANAMAADADLMPGRRELMRRHAGYPGFRALAAVADGQPVGFAYGFHGERGQWWYDAIRAPLYQQTGADEAGFWLADSLEIAEVHVLDRYQNQGIGRRLLLGLTDRRPERTAMLSTPDRESTARRLYRRAGFTDLLADFQFPGGSPAYAVMGAVLPLRDPAAAAGLSQSASPSI